MFCIIGCVCGVIVSFLFWLCMDSVGLGCLCFYIEWVVLWNGSMYSGWWNGWVCCWIV